MTKRYVLLFLLIVPPSGLHGGTCRGNWTRNAKNCKCYKLFSAKKTWDEAKTACAGKQGAKLAELKDFNSNDFIRTKIGEKAWIGSYRCGEDTCDLNNNYVPYTRYAPHEPDMKSDQQSTNQTEKKTDFAILIRRDGKWADEMKQNKYSYICERKELGKSCASLYRDGVRLDGIYEINPDGLGRFQVRCDMQTDGGGWTVFQRRQDASVDFYRGWSNYTAGFGNLNGNFWLGLDKIHRLTNNGQNVLRVDLTDFDNTKVYAKYTRFTVASESENYKLNYRNYSGNAGDSSYQNGMEFSTRDKDNDKTSKENCAVTYKGAWWYNACHWSNLNGLYLKQGARSTSGINWLYWKNDRRSMKISEMKIRPPGY